MITSLIKKKNVFFFYLVRTYIREGIPDYLRGYVWQVLANVSNMKIPNKYKELMEIKVNRNEKDVQVILEDLPRTNPNSTFYKEKFGLGQTKLFNVLTCFSKYYKEVTYVQGYSFIVASFLCYMDEEMAFWLFYTLMESYNLKYVYINDFENMDRIYYKFLSLMKKNNEKIYSHIKNLSIVPSMYCMKWFLSLFFHNNDTCEVALRLFDIFLFEGEETVYKFCLALLRINESRILALRDFDEMIQLLLTIEKTSNLQKWIDTAMKINVTNQYLEELDKKYTENVDNKNDEILEFIKHLN